MSAILRSGIPDCLTQYTSPGPLISRSISESSNPSLVRSIALSLSVGCPDVGKR